jgi:hypothetical protein
MIAWQTIFNLGGDAGQMCGFFGSLQLLSHASRIETCKPDLGVGMGDIDSSRFSLRRVARKYEWV